MSESDFSIQVMPFAELFADPVHPGPDEEGKDEINGIFQGADQRLAKDGHHADHDALAEEYSDEVTAFVHIRDAEGKVHEGGRRKGQDRQHEERRGIEMVDPLLRLFQLGKAGGKFPEKCPDDPPPEQEHERAAHGDADPAVQKAEDAAVRRNVQRNEGDEGQRRKKRLHHGQQNGRDRPQILKSRQQRFPEFQRAQLMHPCDDQTLHRLFHPFVFHILCR